jgi:hypothetical protein
MPMGTQAVKDQFQSSLNPLAKLNNRDHLLNCANIFLPIGLVSAMHDTCGLVAGTAVAEEVTNVIAGECKAFSNLGRPG